MALPIIVHICNLCSIKVNFASLHSTRVPPVWCLCGSKWGGFYRNFWKIKGVRYMKRSSILIIITVPFINTLEVKRGLWSRPILGGVWYWTCFAFLDGACFSLWEVVIPLFTATWKRNAIKMLKLCSFHCQMHQSNIFKQHKKQILHSLLWRKTKKMKWNSGEERNKLADLELQMGAGPH